MSVKISAPVPTPALDKMLAVHDKSQVVGEFIEWLTGERGLSICTFIPGSVEDQFAPAGLPIEELLAEFFEIDLKAVEQEKRAMLAALRAK